MKQHLLIRIFVLAAFLLSGIEMLKAQCTFTGLNATYCTNSPPSNLVPSVSGGVFTGNGVSAGLFSPAVAGPGTHTVNYATCSNTYAISTPSFAPTSTLGTAVSLTDDSESGALPIGFTFKFFCVSYTNFYISSNGFIEFSTTGNGCCSGQPIPNNGSPNNFIAFCWNDLNPGTGGSITYSTTGTSPNRTLTVNYVNIPYFSGGNGNCTSQIRIVETGLIEIHSTSIPGNQNTATMGINNVGGSSAFPAAGRNGVTGWTATNDAVRWTPGIACSVTQTTTVYQAPNVTVAGNNSICIGANVSLTASGNPTYTWSTGSNANNISVFPTSNTTYSVSGINSFGCVSNAAVTVTVDPSVPSLTLVSSNGTGGTCPNSPVILTASGATTYTWSPLITNAVAFTPTISNTYTVTGTNACGNSSAAISISIHPIPPVTASVNNPTVCSGGSIILNGGGAVSYTWNPSAPNNVAFTPNATVNYTVRGTSALGCTASAVQGVTVLITPTIVPVATPTAICLGSTATLSSVGATGYTWSPGNNPNTATLQVSPPGPTTYTLVRSNGPCVNTSTVNLVVNPLPLVSVVASPSQICAGTGVNIVITGPITNTTYPPSPTGFTASNFTVYPNSSVNYTTVGSNGNCTLSVVSPVVVNTSPVISVSTSTNTICQGGNVTLTGTGVGNLTYTWQPSGNNTLTENISPATTTIITLGATNSSGCISTVSQLIVVYPVPNMSLVSSLPFVCAGDVAQLSVVNASNNVVYSWSTGSVSPSIQVNPIVTTNYMVTGSNTITGCQNTSSITLAVFISTFAVTNPTALCKGSTATLSANGQATSYSWTANGGVVAPSITVSPQASTVYYVTGTNGSCVDTKSVNLIVNPLPNVTASVAKGTICRFEVSTITGNGANTYSWNTGASTQTLSFNLTITTTYTLTGTDLNGCAKTVTVTQFVATCQGLESLQGNETGLSIYPNPNNGNFTVSSEKNMTLNIINALGQLVSTIELKDQNNKEVTVNSLPAGVYFITGQADGVKVNKKIIIEK